MDRERVANVVKQMSLDEKIALTSIGADLRTTANPRLKVPSMKLPREFDWCAGAASPSFAALGHTFDLELIKAFSKLRSREAYVAGESFGGAVSLGVTRKPFLKSAARAFSDEPLFVSAMARAYCEGGALSCIGADLLGVTRHNRYIGERALNEIYLRPFRDVKDLLGGISLGGGLCGVPACESRALMKELTKFDGLIFTPAGAVSDKAEQVSSGACLDVLDEKGDGERLKKAVENGLLYERKLDRCIERTVLAAAECYNAYKTLRAPAVTTSEKQALFRRLFEESATLLENDGILPLKKDARTANICFDKDNIEKVTKRLKKLCAGADAALLYAFGADEIAPEKIAVLTMEAARFAPPVLIACAPCYFPLPYLKNLHALVYLPYSHGKKTPEELMPLLTGDTDFTGRLAFCWAKEERAYPYAALGFLREGYCGESVYVGNRYFESVSGGLLYPVGYGLGYKKVTVGGASAKAAGGKIEVECEISADSECETVAFLKANLVGDGVFGVSGQHLAFKRINVGREKSVLSLTAPAPEVYDIEEKKFVRLAGTYKLSLTVSGETVSLSVTLDGDEAKSLSRENLKSYYVTDGALSIDAREAEKLTGALPVGGDRLPRKSETERAEKVLIGEMKKRKRGKDAGFVLSNLPETAKVKLSHALKEKRTESEIRQK